MKRTFWIVVLAILAAVHIALFIRDFRPAGTMHGPNNGLMTGLDLSMRRNEAACVLKGVNPYDVWTKKVVLRPYYPYVEKPETGFSEPINAYTPWEYVVAFPYACLEKQTAWHAHLAVIGLALLTLLIVAVRVGGLPAVAAVLLFVIPINVDLNVGNYPTIIAAAIATMLVALDRGNGFIPAALWSIAMFKPQMSILLAIPLLLRRQWVTCLAAGAICLILTLLPSWLCRVSPLALIAQAPAASAHAFDGCALFPAPLLKVVHPFLPNSVCMALAMAVGLILTIVCIRRLRDSKSWIVLAAPSLLCSISWTYVQSHSYILAIPVAVVLTADMTNHRTPGRLILGGLSILLWARFARGVQIVVDLFMPQLSVAAECACTLSATVALALSVSYLWLYADSLKAIDMTESLRNRQS